MKRIIFIIGLLILCSCYSERKAKKQINKAEINYPEVVADRCNKFYPCINTIEHIDTIVNKEIEEKIVRINDTIKILMNQIDTIPDTHKIELLKNKLSLSKLYLDSLLNVKPMVIEKKIRVTDTRLEEINKYQAEQLNKYRNAYENMMKIALWLLVALTISLIVNFIKKK